MYVENYIFFFLNCSERSDFLEANNKQSVKTKLFFSTVQLSQFILCSSEWQKCSQCVFHINGVYIFSVTLY